MERSCETTKTHRDSGLLDTPMPQFPKESPVTCAELQKQLCLFAAGSLRQELESFFAKLQGAMRDWEPKSKRETEADDNQQGNHKRGSWTSAYGEGDGITPDSLVQVANAKVAGEKLRRSTAKQHTTEFDEGKARRESVRSSQRSSVKGHKKQGPNLWKQRKSDMSAEDADDDSDREEDKASVKEAWVQPSPKEPQKRRYSSLMNRLSGLDNVAENGEISHDVSNGGGATVAPDKGYIDLTYEKAKLANHPLHNVHASPHSQHVGTGDLSPVVFPSTSGNPLPPGPNCDFVPAGSQNSAESEHVVNDEDDSNLFRVRQYRGFILSEEFQEREGFAQKNLQRKKSFIAGASKTLIGGALAAAGDNRRRSCNFDQRGSTDESKLVVPEHTDAVMKVQSVKSERSVRSLRSLESAPPVDFKNLNMRGKAKRIVESVEFDYLSAILIVTNSILLGAQTDYAARNLQSEEPVFFFVCDRAFAQAVCVSVAILMDGWLAVESI